MKLLGLSSFVIADIFDTVSRACAPQPVTALELQQHTIEGPTFLRTCLSQLDQVLHGGIPCGTITEIAGPSGCGKTQFCIMLSLLATQTTRLGGLNGAVAYIDTESAFSAERLVEMAQSRFPEQYSSEGAVVSLTGKIHVYLESTCNSLLQRLQNIEEDLISKGIRLIVIDSIASLIRKEFDSHSGKNLQLRTNLLTKEAAILKYLAEQFSIPIIVTNQITTRFGTDKPMDAESVQDESGHLASLEGEGSYVTAALGNTWSHSVNTRLIVQYLDGPRRQILIAKSPVAPFACFVYTINSQGFVLEDDGADHYHGTDPGLQKIRVRSAIPQDALLY